MTRERQRQIQIKRDRDTETETETDRQTDRQNSHRRLALRDPLTSLEVRPDPRIDHTPESQLSFWVGQSRGT